jgi:hypothetical protein
MSYTAGWRLKGITFHSPNSSYGRLNKCLADVEQLGMSLTETFETSRGDPCVETILRILLELCAT